MFGGRPFFVKEAFALEVPVELLGKLHLCIGKYIADEVVGLIIFLSLRD